MKSDYISYKSIFNIFLSELSRKEQVTSLILLMGWLSLALLEIYAISWIGPLIGSLTTPSVQLSPQADVLLNFLLPFPLNLPVRVGCFTLIVYSAKAIFFFLLLWAQSRFAERAARQRLEGILNYAQKPSQLSTIAPKEAPFLKIIMTDLCAFFFGGIWGAMTIICEMLFILVLLGYGIFIAPALTLIPIVLFSFLLGAYLFISRHWLLVASKRLQSRSHSISENLLNFFRGHKEFWFHRGRFNLLKKVESDFDEFLKANRRTIFINETPRHLVEWLAIASVVLMLLISFLMGMAEIKTLAVIATISVLMFRALPSVGRIASLLSNLRANSQLYVDFFDALSKTKSAIQLKSDRVFPPFKLSGDLARLLANKRGCISILGKSGSGKTTTLEALVNLNSMPEIAELSALKELISNLEARYVPADPIIFRDNLIFNITLDNDVGAIQSDELRSWIQNLDLSSLQMDQIRPSTGEAKRIGLARALYSQPQVILVDEPTASLDDKLAEKVACLLRDFASKNLLVVASHDRFLTKNAEVIIEIH